ncbi:MAG: histidine kinase, partial [Gemmatimonadota bacterium]|nr:histidine kinase [Gemmatimonadota bacterium]
ATVATERVARAEAAAAKAQLAALRAQLHPHFLFNALHSVVHLIPREPERAARAAEQVGALLRTTIEEDRDLVTLGEEWAFVERYLDVERIRFGDRLQVQVDLPLAARDALVPSFSLLTLVENAVRHGVGGREGPTRLTVQATTGSATLTVVVRDCAAEVGVTDEAKGAPDHPANTGAGAQLDRNGTGLSRLRERLGVLYGDRARLTLEKQAESGTVATLVIPVEPGA